MEIASQISAAWARAHVHWQGLPADAFYREYVRVMEEHGRQFDAACATLETCAERLDEALSAVERDMDV